MLLIWSAIVFVPWITLIVDSLYSLWRPKIPVYFMFYCLIIRLYTKTTAIACMLNLWIYPFQKYILKKFCSRNKSDSCEYNTKYWRLSLECSKLLKDTLWQMMTQSDSSLASFCLLFFFFCFTSSLTCSSSSSAASSSSLTQSSPWSPWSGAPGGGGGIFFACCHRNKVMMHQFVTEIRGLKYFH